MILALILVPLFAGVIAFGWRFDVGRRVLLVVTALVHAAVTAAAWFEPPAPLADGWLALDALGLLFLSLVSLLFLAAAVYSVGFFSQEKHERGARAAFLFFHSEPEAAFTGCMLLLLAAMSFVTGSQHFGLLWVGIEATTLTSAPLIYFHRQPRSLEATWKYLLICSVGIALALLGNFLLAAAASSGGDSSPYLVLTDLLASPSLHVTWLQAAFLFFLVGYGTKMGLAPLHTWLPDAYSEGPVVSAMLSGALLNCAFLGILRCHQVCAAAGVGDFSRQLLVVFGLLSMAVAAVFILGQADFKRMLAYSSVEHMGILAFGVGLGGAGLFGSALHLVNHSLIKAGLFLVAGNILAVWGTKSVREVRGVLRVLPLTGVLWLAGFLAITGTPPFGAFLSEFTILKAALDQGHGILGVLFLSFLALIFIGMSRIFLPMAQGQPQPPPRPTGQGVTLWHLAPPVVLCVLALVLGVYIPPGIRDMLHQVARALGG
jgi:hydrogenase-4 component F